MLSDFEVATGVRRVAGGRYDAEIAAGWDIGGNANGGYVIALAARAMADAVGRPPLSITAHYLAPGRPGPVTVSVDTIRDGRRTAVASARLTSGDTDVLALLGTFAHQQPGGPTVYQSGPPEVPPPADCTPTAPPVAAGFHDRVRCRIRPVDAGFRTGEPSGTAEVRGWFEIPDHDPVDAFGLLLAADSFAPVVFNRPEFPVGWSPTLELTVHVRGVPAPGPLRCRFSSSFLSDGMFEETGEIWDSADRLVAQSRQLALIPRG